MEIDGTVFTKVDVETVKFITKMCREIGIVNEHGTMIGRLKDSKVFAHEVDMYGIEHETMLYDQPFDVNYATILMNLYEQTYNYLNLPKEIHDKANRCFGDYRTAYKLELVRK